ncbi:alpha/beta hydrolase-fold protein [Butyrivibrio sp. MC2013]|uniref:alpha/beta hydrolase-fold protein n=1 Tax=Butyrivibrio sp. MC2013 TaxID=1280686 RepID=UPI00042924F3|nr:alpha/beta hydrolase-fold protein [Butyrivibrio sp. MC2013]
MGNLQEFKLDAESKQEHVKTPWEDEMEPGDFISYRQSYEFGKFLKEFEGYEYPSKETGAIRYYFYNPLKHGADKAGKYPLLVWIHGFNCADGINAVGHSGGEQFASPKYQEALGGGAFILVPLANEKWVNGEMEGAWSEVYFEPLAKLVRSIKNDYQDNVSKTAIAGGSSGGWMAWVMAERYTDLFDISIPISSGYIPAREELMRMGESGLKTFVMHGKRDELCSFDEYVKPRLKDLEEMPGCVTYFPDWVRNGDGGVASVNFGFEMGQHCVIVQAQTNLIYLDGKPYDERFTGGLTGWIRECCEE